VLLLLWMVLVVILIVLLLLLLLLLRIAVTDPIVVPVRGHHVVGIIDIAGTAATTAVSVSHRGVRMSVRIGLQLDSGSAPKIGISLFLLPIPVGGLAPGGSSRLLLITIAVVSLAAVVRGHRVQGRRRAVVQRRLGNSGGGTCSQRRR